MLVYLVYVIPDYFILFKRIKKKKKRSMVIISVEAQSSMEVNETIHTLNVGREQPLFK